MKHITEELAQTVAELIKDCSEWNEAAVEIRRFNREDPHEAPALLEEAFDYNLVFSPEEQRDQWGPLAPLMEGEGKTYPPVIAAVPDTQASVWAEAHEMIERPLVRSRLGDLLWLSRHGSQAHLYARSAQISAH